jgi:hypothetical protein
MSGEGSASASSGDGAAAGGQATGEGTTQSTGENGASVKATGEGGSEGEGEKGKIAEVRNAGEETTKEVSDKTPESKETNKLFAKFRELSPDKVFENDDAIRDHIISEYDNLSDYKTKNLEANKKVLEVLKATPELGEVIKEVSKGVPFNVALAMHVDMDNVKPKEGDTDYAAYGEAMNKRLANQKESETRQENITKNQEVSRKVIKEFFDSKKMDEAQVKEFADFMDGVFTKVNDGIIDADVLNHFYNAKNFTSQIKTEKEVAEIKGKNENIDLKKEEKPKGDGLPQVGQGENKKPEKVVEKGPLDDMFAKVEAKNNIYK